MYNCLRMKKVLIVFNHPAPYKVRLFNELAKRMDLTVIFERDSNKNRGQCFYDENKYQFKTVSIKGRKLGDENFISSGVKKHLKQNQYDLVVMNGYSTFAEMKAIRYLNKKHIPFVLMINGGLINHHELKLKKHLKTKYISSAKAYLSPNEESNEYLKYYGAHDYQIFNYHNSTIFHSELLEKTLTKEEKDQIKEAFNLEGETVYVSAGQFIARKNFLTLIQNWKDMPKTSHLYLFGDGKKHDKYEKTIRELQIKNVHLRDFLPKHDLLKVLSVSDIFLFPSLEDIYGHVVNESLSQGTPVISNLNVNSAKKLITDGWNGFLTSDFSAHNIERLSRDLLNEKVRANCLSIAKENTIEIMVDEISQILLEKVEL